MKTQYLVLIAAMYSSFAFADLSVVTGKYTVTNDECLDTGNAKGSPVSIVADGAKLEIKIDGDKPVTLHMLEGKTGSTLPNGDSFSRSGTTFGNGFLYGEEERNGRLIVSDVEYRLIWSDSELQFSKTVRLNSRHSSKVWCDLKPVK